MFTIQTEPLSPEDAEGARADRWCRKLERSSILTKLVVPKQYVNTVRPHPDLDIKDEILRK